MEQYCSSTFLYIYRTYRHDLAAYLGDSKRTIYKYIASGDCPPYIRISAKNIKFDRADVDAWLESKKVNPKEIKERKKK